MSRNKIFVLFMFCWIPSHTDLLGNEAAGTAPVLRNFTPDRALSSDIRVYHLCPVLLLW
jgi:hypothetical protein